MRYEMPGIRLAPATVFCGARWYSADGCVVSGYEPAIVSPAILHNFQNVKSQTSVTWTSGLVAGKCLRLPQTYLLSAISTLAAHSPTAVHIGLSPTTQCRISITVPHHE
jgi:hypothetical protein